MERGICKLCLKEKDLLDCHLISSAVSKLLRARENTNPNPLRVTPDWIGQTSEQVSAYEFCRACEDIFNERGEKWLLPRLASLDGFPLYDMLGQAPAFFRQEPLFAYHACDIPEFEKEKVIHFAMAIFWKASVRDWGTKGNTIHLDFGRYAESMSEFVLGTGPYSMHRESIWLLEDSMATAKKHYARYYIVRGFQTMWMGDAAQTGSLYRSFVITSNEFNSTQGTFQVYGLEGTSGGIKAGKFVPSEAEPSVLFDQDFNGLDSAAKQFDALVADTQKRGFKPITMMEILEFEDKLRRSK